VLKHLSRIKYYWSEDKKFYQLVYRMTGIHPTHIDVYKVAFIHKSAVRPENGSKNLNNERLEFLGDAILASVVADYLFKFYPYQKEGFLTKLRARIVNREQLNEIALNMGLQYHIVAQSRFNGTKNVYGNALEALIGAVYIDKGYNKTKEFILKKIILKHIDVKDLAEHDSDYKSQLIEWAQKNKFEILFDDEEVESTEQSNLYFTSIVKVNDKILGQGKGLSKKEAQQKASHQALNNIELVCID